MLTGPIVILTLKCAVLAVTLLLLSSFVALARGQYWLHGRINLVFLIFTIAAVLGLEGIVQYFDRHLFDYLLENPETRWFLCLHLSFCLPTTLVLPLMYYTGRTHRRELHFFLAGVFSILWTGTFVTGIFFLPHQ